MNAAEIITDKRDGKELSEEQLNSFVQGYAKDEVPDYQMAAFAMAVYFQGMTHEEVVAFTTAMLDSGDRMKWSRNKKRVDKHSTGGIGDKVSIPLAPILACCDLDVPMVSGRGLGTTGGTLDKLESIPGFRCEMSMDEFRSVVNSCGCAIVSASENLAPADKKLYALRDVTGTVPSIPLITASILSKKMAEGLDALVLDVKWGSGAFMKTLEQAQELARSLVRTANGMGVKTTALITDMNQPLGRMIGNALEIDESIAVLEGEGPEDVAELTIELGAELLVSAGKESNLEDGRQKIQQVINGGAPLQRLEELISAQGGDLNAPRKLGFESAVKAAESGYVCRINTERIGMAIIEMGGGRKKIGEEINHSVGLEFLVRIGDKIEEGQPIAKLYCDDRKIAEYAASLVSLAVGILPTPTEAPKLIIERI